MKNTMKVAVMTGIKKWDMLIVRCRHQNLMRYW